MLNKKTLAAARIASGTVTDPDFEYVTMLLHGDGTNGAQNNTFIDGSTNNFTVTRNGNTTQGSLNPFGDRWSNYFDGTGDWLTVPSNSAFDQTGDFTFETWVRVDATVTGTYSNFGNVFSQETPNIFKFGFNKSRQFVVLEAGVGSPALTSTTTFVIGVWYHVAVVRSGMSTNNLKLYVNGVQEAQATRTNSVASANTTFIGRESWSGDPSTLTGAISNLRYVKGTAVYTSNFTPPTAPLTAISGTSLLTCQSNRFVDNSSNNFTITRNGDVSVRPFSPFSPSAAYSTGTNGGSGYFDGSGDNLSTPTSTALDFGTSDFTVEAWVYIDPTVNPFRPDSLKTVTVFSTGSSGSNDCSFAIYGSTSTAGVGLELYQASPSVAFAVAAEVATNTWVHVAWVRSGTTIYGFVNGKRYTLGTTSASISSGTTPKIGIANTTNYSNQYKGYISNLRVVKGTAVYTSNFTLPTAPLTAITNTSLLLNFTNGGIFDNAADNVLETVGNAQISTSVKKYGTGSMAFDGTGDWLLTPDSVDLRLGTGNFTIEFWLYLSATGAARGVVGKGGSTTGWLVSVNSSNVVVFTYGTSTITSTGTLSGSTWYHIAVVRSGTGTNQTKIYIDGTNDGTGTVSTDFTQTEAMYVGANRTGGDALNGYIDDLRITKGVARYTANFTPPTAAFPDL